MDPAPGTVVESSRDACRERSDPRGRCMNIHGFTFSAFGHCASKEIHDSRKLTHEALAYLTSVLDMHGNEFQLQIPMRGVGKVELHWNSEHLSCGLASFSAEGELLSTVVITSGIDAEADQKALEKGQVALRNVCAAAGEEAPAEELLRIQERPAMASIRWSTRDRKAMDLLTDMEVCLAGAFLERAFKTREMAL